MPNLCYIAVLSVNLRIVVAKRFERMFYVPSSRRATFSPIYTTKEGLMAIAKTVLINFHVGYKKVTIEGTNESKLEPDPKVVIAQFGDAIDLEEQTRETAELKAKEAARRAAQNPDARPREQADTGTQIVDAEPKCRLEELIRDLFASGFRLTDAYWEHKRQYKDGQPTDVLKGRVYRLVLVHNATDEQMFLSEKDASKLVENLLKEIKNFVAPCVTVWDNPSGTQTVNIGRNFRRKGPPSRHVGSRSLRYRLGEYHIEPAWRHKPYTPPPRVQ